MSKGNRSVLSTLIIDKEMNFSGSSTITAIRLLELAMQVTKLFPNETANIYYIPYNKHLKQLARGRLYDSMNSFKRKMRKDTPKKSVKIAEITPDIDTKSEIFDIEHPGI